MIKHKIGLGVIILMGASACLSASVFAALLQILDFKKGQLTQAEQKQLCLQVKALCENQAKWQSLKTPDQTLWVLSEGNIAQFAPSATGFKLLTHWQITLTPSDEMARSNQYIFPKLFPMQQNRYAIAVIDSSSEMYSGGGANIERASFYELQANGNTRAFIQDYPFSFSRMVRACFSEQDYATSKGNCHDEDGLSLDIRPIKPMLWQFRYRYRLDVSPASDSGERSYKGGRDLNIDLNKAPKQPIIPEQWNYTGQG